MDGLEIFIGIVMLIVMIVVMFKYKTVEAAIFDNGDTDYHSIGDDSMKMCIVCGAAVGATAFIYQIINDRTAFSLGFSSIWGIIVNGLPYAAFACISASVYKACTTETTPGRMVGRSLFVITACLLGMAGGAAGSVIAIVAIVFIAIISVFFKTAFSGGGTTPKTAETQTTITMQKQPMKTDGNANSRKTAHSHTLTTKAENGRKTDLAT